MAGRLPGRGDLDRVTGDTGAGQATEADLCREAGSACWVWLPVPRAMSA